VKNLITYMYKSVLCTKKAIRVVKLWLVKEEGACSEGKTANT
jgi:hypothetical protein